MGQIQNDRRNSIDTIEYLNSGEAGDCDVFRVSSDVILKHLSSAQPVAAQNYADDLHSPCKVSGILHAADNRTYDFVLQSSGVAVLRNNGREVFLFAKPAWIDPYAGAYQNRD